MPTSSLEQGNEVSSNGTSYVTSPTVVYTGLNQYRRLRQRDDVFRRSSFSFRPQPHWKRCAGSLRRAEQSMHPSATASTTIRRAPPTSATWARTAPGPTALRLAPSSTASGNNVAQFTAHHGRGDFPYLVTNSTNFDFTPLVRPVYVSIEWIAGSSKVSQSRPAVPVSQSSSPAATRLRLREIPGELRSDLVRMRPTALSSSKTAPISASRQRLRADCPSPAARLIRSKFMTTVPMSGRASRTPAIRVSTRNRLFRERYGRHLRRPGVLHQRHGV